MDTHGRQILLACYGLYSLFDKNSQISAGLPKYSVEKRIHMKILLLFYLKCLFNIFLPLKTFFKVSINQPHTVKIRREYGDKL